MMDNLRAAANHIALKIILGLIIVSFVLTGVGGYVMGGNANYAAEVNGQEIGRGQFENAVINERSRQQQQYGEQFSELAANEGYMQNLRKQVLNQMIDQTLLDQYAKTLGLGISDEQIKMAIFSQPAFQSDGRFDNERYNTLIRNMGMTPDQYAQALRNQLTTEQLIKAVIGTDFMLKGETDELISLISQQRLVKEAVINVGALAEKQTASDQEINAYYDSHKNDFIAPERFKVSYLMLDVANFKEKATDADIEAYYDQHKAEFTQPQRDRYSIIQTKTAAEAQSILDALKNGADFATLAKEKSADIISGRNGGDMGWLEASTTPDELKNAGLTKKGELSGVITSSVGFLVARLDDIEPAKEKPLAEVRASIVQKLEQDKAIDAYYAQQQKVSNAASNDNESLASAEQAAGTKAQQTDWFTRTTLPAAINFKPVVDVIFGGSLLGQGGAPGSNSDIITVDGDRAFVLRITDHQPESVEPLSDVRSQVISKVKREKAEAQAKQQAEKLLIALNQGKGEEAMQAADLHFGEVQTLNRNDQNAINEVAYSLPLPSKDKPSYGVAENQNGDVVIVALDEVKSGTMPDAQKQAIVQGITQNNAQLTFEALMSSLRQQAKIKLGDAIEQQ